MARNMMDISPGYVPFPMRDPLPVPLGGRPLSPWLRLAHVSSYPHAQATHTARLRTLLDFELVFQFEGAAWIWLERAGGSMDVRQGEIAFIPPGFVHGWASEPGAHIAVHFDLHAQPRLVAQDNIRYTEQTVSRKPAAAIPQFILQTGGASSDGGGLLLPLVTRLRRPAQWRERLEPLVRLWQRRAHGTAAAQLLFAETIGWALRTIREDAAQGESGAESGDGADARVLEILRELDAAGAWRPSVSELAERARMGLTAFRAAFEKATGRGPRAYMEERRVERAARTLVETDRSVYEIAEDEGYEDPYHFSRIFKRVTGLSPRHYRRKTRKGSGG